MESNLIPARTSAVEGQVMDEEYELLDKLEKWFENSQDHTRDSDELAEVCEDYFHGDQLTDAEVKELERRGQPIVVINRIRGKIKLLKGVEITNRTRPRALPRTPKVDKQGVDACTDAINYVLLTNDWSRKRTQTFHNLLVGGIGAVELTHKNPKKADKNPKICVNIFPRHRHFADPHSECPGFTDARYQGLVSWTDRDQLVKDYPDLEGEVDHLILEAGMAETYDDRPHFTHWADYNRKRIRKVTIYWNDGSVYEPEWKWAVMIKGHILDSGDVPYVDEEGYSFCPVIAGSMYVDRENNRYGVVKDLISPQDEINKRRSRALHLLSTRQTLSERGALESVKKAKMELSKADGHIEVNPGYFDKFRQLDNSDIAAGHVQLLMEAKMEIDGMGVNPVLAGQGAGSQGSGRAVLANQSGALVEIADELDVISWLTHRVYRGVWYMIRNLWTEEDWLRISKDERNFRFVGINVRKTFREYIEDMEKRATELKEKDPAMAQRIVDQMFRVLAANEMADDADPRWNHVAQILNNVQELDVDIELEEVPDQKSVAAESWAELVEISSSQPGLVPPEVLVEAAPNLRSEHREKIIQGITEQRQQQMDMAKADQAVEDAKAQSKMGVESATAKQKEAGAVKALAEAEAIDRGLKKPPSVGNGDS